MSDIVRRFTELETDLSATDELDPYKVLEDDDIDDFWKRSFCDSLDLSRCSRFNGAAAELQIDPQLVWQVGRLR